METKYVSAVILDGPYEIVVASEGIKPFLGRGWLPGLDVFPTNEDCVEPRLAILERTPDLSAILIKEKPSGREDEIYRLFLVEDGRLTEMNKGRVNDWQFDEETGCLFQVDETGRYEIRPDYYGYCEAAAGKGCWDPEQHYRATAQEAGEEDTPIPSFRIGRLAQSLPILNRLIKLRRHVDKLEAAINQLAASVDIIGDDLPQSNP